MKLRPLTYGAARALPLSPWPWFLPSVVMLMLGLLLTRVGDDFGWQLIVASFFFFFAVTTWWLIREVFPAQTTRGVVKRQGDREQRAGGVASYWDVAERGSRRALQLQAHTLRPSLASVPVRKRDPRAVGVLIARTGFGRWPLRHFQEVWSSCEDTTLRVGSPGVGKTIGLALHGIDAPGALITTSTKLDLAEYVHQARQRKPVWIFNPMGFGGVPSTVRWNILIGCGNYSTARRRVRDLIPPNPDGSAETWDSKARTYLPVLLHAAAIGERRVEDVERWISDLGEGGDLGRAQREVEDILAVDASKTRLLRQLITTTGRTRSGITQTMSQAISWMADDIARSVGAAPLHAVTLDISKLITTGETLHCIGPAELGGPEARLVSAFLAEIAHQARMLASRAPRGRLDPPMTMVIDEAAVAVRLPLPDWTADWRGLGITGHISVQSLAQLYRTWGPTGGDVLLGNVGTLILHGGGKDANELDTISKLTGEFYRRVIHEDTKIEARMPGVQRGEWEKVRVTTAAQLSNMLTGEVLVLKKNLGGAFKGRTPTVLQLKGWQAIPLTKDESVTPTIPLQAVRDAQEEAA